MWKEPKNVREIQSYLGFANYYCQFMQGFAQLANPLTEATKRFHWEEA